MTPVRRTLAAYLAGAMVVAVLVLFGIAVLGGTLGPLVVAVAAALAAFSLQRWAAARLGDAPLEGEDQTLRAVATGLLLLAVVLAVLAAIVIAVS
jgi:predicted PurR-regulated permease PerM